LPGLRGRAPIFLFFSRFHPKKGLDIFLDAFARVAVDFPGAALLAAGIPEDHDYLARLQRRAAAPDLCGRAFFTTALTGNVGRIVFDAANVFILPSHEEGFSMALLEAMAFALPVLISDRCHMDGVATRGAGVVVPPTIDGIERGLRDLLGRDDATLSAMGKAGRAWVEAELSWHSVSRQLEQLYDEIRR
jgi:glycosyltransferase involved in cell wall biosynthesis